MNAVNSSEIEIEHERLQQRAFQRVSHIMRAFKGDECVEMLKQTFVGGEPSNRHIRDANGQWVDYVRHAYDLGNVSALAYLIDVNFAELEKTGRLFKNYLQFPQVLDVLVKHGRSFKNAIEHDPGNFWITATSQGRDFFIAIATQGANFDGLLAVESVRVPAITRFAIHPKENDVISHLLAAGANPEVRGTGGMSVLHGAVTQGKAKRTNGLDSDDNVCFFDRTLRAVLGAGVSVDMVDDEGRSALHYACKFGYFNKARALLEAGADQDLKDKDGVSPKDLAKSAKRRDVLQLFASMRARSAILDVARAALDAPKIP